MKILVFSLDSSLLDKNSRASKRVEAYGLTADAYHILVPSRAISTVRLSDSVRVWSASGSNKLSQIYCLVRQAVHLARGVHYNLISVQDQYYLALVGILLGWWYRIPVEVQVHGFEKYHGVRKALSKMVLKHAAGVRVVSRRLKDKLVNELGITEQKISVIPVFADVASCRQREKEGGNLNFISVARLVPVKDIDLLIAAFAKLHKIYPQAKLSIVGGGPERERLESAVERLKLSADITFFGHHNNVCELLLRADYFVLSSKEEGWGLAVIEAAAAGLPIIMTDVGCAGEFIINVKNGLIVPVGSVSELTSAMKRLVEDDKLAKRLAATAQESVKRLPTQRDLLYQTLTAWQKIARP